MNRFLIILYVIALMVPNVALCFTESIPWMVSLTNILLPAGFYLLVMSLFKRTGWGVWALLPCAIFAAFQIVLLFLYGGSIIAVDMFLNVVTTNVQEATELLRNLGTSLVVVSLLYLPPLVIATYCIIKRKDLDVARRRQFRITALVMAGAGIILTLLLKITGANFELTRDIFPVNVIYNVKVAVDRSIQTANYDLTSHNFTYHAHSTHPSHEREIYIMVIGETSRAMNWQLEGYDRPTNPKLSQRRGLTFFKKTFSESNTTHKSVPMLLSHITACDFDSINKVKSILEAFREANFKTTFISNQAPNHSYTQHFGEQADNTIYMQDTLGRHRYDHEMLPIVAGCIADTTAQKQFIVIHSYGSHFKYAERYPPAMACYTPDDCLEVSSRSRDVLINAYDNTILYTDYWLDRLFEMLEQSDCMSAVLYASDHGEDILDDHRERFLHASPTPTGYQLHVAMLSWLSTNYRQSYPHKQECLQSYHNTQVSSTATMFNTMLDLAGIATPYYNSRQSLASDDYKSADQLYLTDHNRGVPVANSGIKDEDVAYIANVAKL